MAADRQLTGDHCAAEDLVQVTLVSRPITLICYLG
jgi:hypothetical protein